MSNNIFSGKRFQLLLKQHFIHNTQFLLLATGAYVGVIFIVLTLAQIGNDLKPHGLSHFQELMSVFVALFSILYVGHSFPAFRSKESTISYLMIPASVLEKFIFEFVSRIGFILLTLPLLFWLTFNLQGYFFAIFTDHTFEPVGLQHTVKLDAPEDYQYLIYALIIGGGLFALSLAFTGAAMFTKQPLVRSLFAVALVVMFFGGYSYLVIEHLGLEKYNPPDTMVLLPMHEGPALIFFTLALYVASAVMLFVAYLKLKEREV